MSSNMEYDRIYKIVLIGDCEVGKSSILTRYCDNKFDNSYMSTVGVDLKNKIAFHNNKEIKLFLWDTTGQEKFRQVTTSYLRGAHAALLIFDVTNANSFKSLQYWIKHLSEYKTHIVLVGNKIDDHSQREVNLSEVNDFISTQEIECDYIEISAKNDVGINNLFYDLYKKLDQRDYTNPCTFIPNPFYEKKWYDRCII